MATARLSRSEEGEIVSSAGFSRAVQMLLPALRRYAYRLTHDLANTDDLVQDALASAWRGRKTFQSGTNLRAWLFRILRNRFLSGMRSAWRQTGWDPQVDERRLVDIADQETGLMLEDLERAIVRLPEGHAEALCLIVRDGLSYDEAAERLNLPSGTLKSRVHRARAMLLDHLNGAVPICEPDAECRAPESRSDDGKDRTAYAQWKRSGSLLIG